MGTISGGNYILSQTGDQADAGIGRGLEYPAKSAGTLGQVPTIGESAIGWETPAGGGQSQITYQAVTLAAANWSSNTQTVTVTGVSATETNQLIQPVPALVSQSAYLTAGILVTAQAANSLTFTCTETPSSDLTVYVVLTDLEAAS